MTDSSATPRLLVVEDEYLIRMLLEDMLDDLGYGIAAAQSIKGPGGALIPVIIGEFGDSTDGTKVDANGEQVITAVLNSGYGFAAWAWESSTPGDRLTVNGMLTPFGRRVADAIAAGARGSGRPH